jgi:nitroimidazol reductase NimA-like FMN-containing flavoprotein (pyridoxamine 5'-phosphate oxidase superfamily)
MTLTELEPLLRDLFATQLYAVLGTQSAETVTLNLMAFAATSDLRALILVTERATTKYANLQSEPRVSLLVDSRSNQGSDTQTALALTVDGLAEEVAGPEREQLALRLLARHPLLDTFVHSPTCALFRVHVMRYELVLGLYDVREVLLTL